jgi:hypothetical protein
MGLEIEFRKGAMQMISLFHFWLMLVMVIIFFILPLSASYADDLIPIRTPSTGYQPQFQVLGNKIYYVWHEDHGPTEPIWVAVETLQ